MFGLDDIFYQANKDSKSAKIIENGYKSASLLDIKIIKDNSTQAIDLLNTKSLQMIS